MVGSLQSHAQLTFRYDQERQRTVLTQRKAGGLCHLSKPYWDGEVLGLQLVNPTAGLFSGDSLHLEVTLGAHAQVALTSPSASRYHTMPEGRAHLTQTFTIGLGGWLDYWPEMTIPQRDSDVCQTTAIHLQEGSSMAFLDLMAPGRVAHGERYQFRRLETRLVIFREGQQLVQERCVLEPAQSIWPLHVPGWDLCYYGAVWISGAQAAPAIAHIQGLDLGERANCLHGATLVANQLGVIRLLARSSFTLRQALHELRQHLRTHENRLATHFRKL